MLEENCYKHLDTQAVMLCFQCKRLICEACKIDHVEEYFCSHFCIDKYKKKQRSELFSQLTSVKLGLIYFGFFLLAVYLMYIVHRFQSGAMTLSNLWPHVIAYLFLGLIMGIVFLIISVSKSNR